MRDDFGVEETRFEAELRQFKAAGVPVDVRAQVAVELASGTAGGRGDVRHRTSWADRFLMGAMSLGAAAAVTIVTLLGVDAMHAQFTGERAAVVAGINEYPRSGEPYDMLAQISGMNDGEYSANALRRAASGGMR